MTRQNRINRIGLWLVACALALRLVVAPGFMPVVSPHGFAIKMCGGAGDVVIPVSGKPDLPMHGQAECAFAGLSAVAWIDDTTPSIGIPPMAPIAQLLSPMARAPHIGAPAPPPPAIGPPVLI